MATLIKRILTQFTKTEDLPDGGAIFDQEEDGYIPRPLKAVFIDKDGTLINDVPYNVDPERITLSCKAAEGLRQRGAAR